MAKNPLKSTLNERSDSSIPAFSTVKRGVKAPFLNPTDKSLSKMTTGKAKIYDAKGDLSKQWYIEFYCIFPPTGKLRRIRKMLDINEEKTVAGRREKAGLYKDRYDEYLALPGWNYFNEPKVVTTINKNILSCIDLYLKEKEGRIAKKTFAKYRQILNNLKEFVNKNHLKYYDIGSIDKQIVLKFLSERATSQQWSNKTYNNILLDLSTFFNYFINNFDNILHKNPLKGVTRLREFIKGHTAYSDKQVADIKKYLAEHNEFLLLFCQTVYETCTRPQTETRKLQCGMFDFQRGVLRISSEIAKNNTTDYVPLRKEFLERLKEYGVDKASPEEYLFTRYRRPGKSPIREETVQLWYANAKKDLGMGPEYTIYSWKHTRNIHVWLDTKDVMFIKTLNRHKTLEMTMKYLRDLGCFVDNQELLEKTRQF